jgi:prepilin signal peptidase PulO-like enzyme (type II secretory pathway)
VIIYLIIFIFGLVVGSFLNCIIYRSEINESFLVGRSFCPKCRHKLAWYDLIPVLSFLILKGKCRYCNKKISWQYPLVELTTGTLFVLIMSKMLNISGGVPLAIWNYESGITNYDFLNLRFILNSLFLLLNSCFLVIIFVYDLKHYIIPDKIIYPAIIVSGAWYLVAGVFLNLYTRYEMLNIIYSAAGAAAFFLIIIFISKGKWMGLGDVKLAFLMGLVLGFPEILVALFLAFFFGAIIGLGLILSGRKTLKSEIPFGPFLIAGTFLAMFWGSQMVSRYLNFFI